MSELESLREQVKDLEARLLHDAETLKTAEIKLSACKAGRKSDAELYLAAKAELKNLKQDAQLVNLTSDALTKEQALNFFYQAIDRAEKAERELKETQERFYASNKALAAKDAEIDRLNEKVKEVVEGNDKNYADYQETIDKLNHQVNELAKEMAAEDIAKLNAEILRLMEEVERLNQDGGHTGRLKEDQVNE